jgi:hypothetical protein
MSQAEGPLPKKIEYGLLIAAAILLVLVLVCGLCAAILLVQYLFGVAPFRGPF